STYQKPLRHRLKAAALLPVQGRQEGIVLIVSSRFYWTGREFSRRIFLLHRHAFLAVKLRRIHRTNRKSQFDTARQHTGLRHAAQPRFQINGGPAGKQEGKSHFRRDHEKLAAKPATNKERKAAGPPHLTKRV
ncbi:MAG: hypothetical protein LUH45_06115, partial [Clostridiales bacterium]|nr:hypothetical protein [Clostridiales bacterium]